jgi:hypothetical protein
VSAVGRSEGILILESALSYQVYCFRATHIVKQSAMNATATGLMLIATSSGMGGASLRLPNL